MVYDINTTTAILQKLRISKCSHLWRMKSTGIDSNSMKEKVLDSFPVHIFCYRSFSCECECCHKAETCRVVLHGNTSNLHLEHRKTVQWADRGNWSISTGSLSTTAGVWKTILSVIHVEGGKSSCEVLLIKSVNSLQKHRYIRSPWVCFFFFLHTGFWNK